MLVIDPVRIVACGGAAGGSRQASRVSGCCLFVKAGSRNLFDLILADPV
jgi:hypothetical protein